MKSWDMDPQKKDYVLERGSPAQTDSLRVPAYFRLKTRRAQWMYAPSSTYGSEFHLQRKRRTDSENSTVEDLAISALQPIQDDGRATEIQVEATVKNRHNVSMDVKITDAEGNVETLSFFPLGV